MAYQFLIFLIMILAFAEESLSSDDQFEQWQSSYVGTLFRCKDELEEQGKSVELGKCVFVLKEKLSDEVKEICTSLAICFTKQTHLMTENGKWNRTEITRIINILEPHYEKQVGEFKTIIEPICLNSPGIYGELISGTVHCALKKSKAFQTFYESIVKDLGSI